MAYNLSPEKKSLAVAMLCEGSSIRGVERVTGVHRDTIMRLGVRVGEECARIMDKGMTGLNCVDIQVDEAWGFIGKKNARASENERLEGLGDVWTWIALDRESKLIPAFSVGKRDSYHAKAFIGDLSERLKNRPQISSDGLRDYVDAVERAFGSEVDYGQIVKTYSVSHLGSFKEAAKRYSPAEVVKAEKKVIQGNPDISRISTSHI